MAGDIYIEKLDIYDIMNIERCGGVLEKKVFHSDKTNFAVLERRLGETIQNRQDLPAHCYFTFEKNKTDQIDALRLGKLWVRTSLPSSIVKVKQDLRDAWDRINIDSESRARADIDRGMALWRELQKGAIKLEFYKVGNLSVKDYFPDFQMIKE